MKRNRRRWRLGAAEGDNSCDMLALVLLTVNKALCYLLVVFEWLWKSVRRFECRSVYLALVVVEKVGIPIRKIDVLGTQVLLLILRPGHPPDIKPRDQREFESVMLEGFINVEYNDGVPMIVGWLGSNNAMEW